MPPRKRLRERLDTYRQEIQEELAASQAAEQTKAPEPTDLAYLNHPISRGTRTTDAGEAEIASVTITDAEVDNYDIEKAKKRIIVLGLQRVEMALTSKMVDIFRKAELSLKAMYQFEGTRKVIEWDKRIPDEKQLLEKADVIGRKLQELAKQIPKEKLAELEIKAAEALMAGSFRELDKN